MEGLQWSAQVPEVLSPGFGAGMSPCCDRGPRVYKNAQVHPSDMFVWLFAFTSKSLSS